MNGTAAARPVPARKTRKMPASNVDNESPRTPCWPTMPAATATKRIFGALIRTFDSPSPEARSTATAAQETPQIGRNPDAIAIAMFTGKIWCC